MLNIADNSIGNEGVSVMMNDLQPERVSLMYLNLNNNELSYPSIVKLEPILKFGHLLDLRLS